MNIPGSDSSPAKLACTVFHPNTPLKAKVERHRDTNTHVGWPGHPSTRSVTHEPARARRIQFNETGWAQASDGRPGVGVKSWIWRPCAWAWHSAVGAGVGKQRVRPRWVMHGCGRKSGGGGTLGDGRGMWERSGISFFTGGVGYQLLGNGCRRQCQCQCQCQGWSKRRRIVLRRNGEGSFSEVGCVKHGDGDAVVRNHGETCVWSRRLGADWRATSSFGQVTE